MDPNGEPTGSGRAPQVPPDARPRRRRTAVRVLMIDDRERMLLFEDSDAAVGHRWWITPGGGIDPGESELAAAVREVAEETGLVLDPATLRGPLAAHDVLHGYSDVVVEQHDTYYVVEVAAFEVSTDGQTDDEKRTMVRHRWWTRSDLAATDDDVWPRRLVALWELAGTPDAWPRTIATSEESSVPVHARSPDQPSSSPG